MALTLEEINQRVAQAEQAFNRKEYNQAVSFLESITRENPGYAPAYRRLGSILMHSPSQEKALNYLQKALELVPDDAENWIALGYFYKRCKKWAEAIKAFRQALSCRGGDRKILQELMELYRTAGNLQAALTISEKLRKTDPKNSDFLQSYAELLKESGKNKEALAQYDLLLKSEREDISVAAVEVWYELMEENGDIKEARNRLKKLSEKSPDDAMLMLVYARSCEANFEDEETMRLLLEAHRLAPENVPVNYMLGTMYERTDDRKNSLKYFTNALNKNPLYATALRAVGKVHHYNYGDERFKRLNFAAAHTEELPIKQRAELHFALGKAYDDVGDHETAFEHFRLGGALHSQGRANRTYDDALRIYTDTEKRMGKAFFGQTNEIGYPSKKPVFVVGMPRSGTSLIEQVLSSMEGVYGAGELEYSKHVLNQMDIDGFKLNFGEIGSCFPENRHPTYEERGEKYLQLVEALAPKESRRIIDKAPQNFLWLGHLHLILPNASIVHSRRHPVETCLSAYRIHFAKGQYWSDDLRMMGKYYRLYTELMQHWKSVLPEGTILDVRYEDMVSDLERESKRLAAHIGMPWDASCLAFHEFKRPVRTASVSQVRKPIYNTSINRWHKYEPYLKPLLDEIGDIVEAYEAELAEDF